ncbi:MAG TPA: prepilin-type N-terminal cleavage/methylation domain-containing protein [Pseudoxanthomonas sp.]|nr:prepilin-type N-terminal cleavage/methylation domain-containing protein [Pseudoxanthomonas sp.]
MATIRPERRQGGFTILEMSVVLVVIALIIGAVSVGRDVYRSAVAERISSDFVQGWIIAYDRYTAQVGAVPGDDPANPTGRINGAAGSALCDDDLRDEMLSRGIALPQGRAEGMENRYVYQDGNGGPQELRVCLLNVNDWSEPAAGATYAARPRNVMRFEGLTAELAGQIDLRLDGRIDARFGRFREDSRYDDTSAVGSPPAANPWSEAEPDPATYNREENIPTMVGYLKMNR